MPGPGAAHVAVVTGANHGIGAGIARALAADGVAVLISYLRIEDDVDPAIPDAYRHNRAGSGDEVAAAIVAGGGRATAVELDLTCDDAATVLLDTAERELGPVDILVNNATGWVQDTFAPGPVDHVGRRMQPVTVASFDQQFGVDARASALLVAEFARRHLARGGTWGRIVGLTSGGPLGFPSEVSYGAAKAALENYTMSASVELAAHGVTANVVHPPVTDTGWVTDAVREFVAGSPEHHHVATPDEVGEVVAYLASDAARLLTGNVIRLR